MTSPDHELEQLLADAVEDRPPPQLIPWGWRIFFFVLAAFDVVCLLIGRVPWSGGERGLDRLDVLMILVVGVGVGAIVGLLAEAIATSRATGMGLTPEEAQVAADELSILTRPPRRSRLSIVPLVAAVLIVCTLVAKAAFADASLPTVTAYFVLHALAGLAIPVLSRTYRQAHHDFQVWLDEKNAPFDPAAAKRAAARRARTAEITAHIRQLEDELTERLDAMPRVAPPLYLQPLAMWAPLALAVVLDIFLLASPDARAAALGAQGGGGWTLTWRVIVLWVQSCVLIGIVWALLSWFYVDVADQVSRQWTARDWSGGLSVIAIELVYGGLVLAFLAGLALGWAPRFVTWNALAATPLLLGVLRDIRETAAEHHERSVRERADEAGPAPKGNKPADEADAAEDE